MPPTRPTFNNSRRACYIAPLKAVRLTQCAGSVYHDKREKGPCGRNGAIGTGEPIAIQARMQSIDETETLDTEP